MGLRLGLGLGVGGGRVPLDVDALSYFSRAGISSAAQTPTTFQNASTFSGTTQSLTVASNSTLQVGGSSFSFSCWFNPSVSAGPQTLIQKTVSGALEYSFGLGGTGQVRGLLGNAGSSWTFILDTPFNPSAGRWTQAVWTYDGTTLRIYINGSLSVSATGPAITTSGTAPLEIGRETGAAFNGSISSVGFWKRAISASEVTALFNSGSGRTYASLDSSIRTNMVSWWDLSETSGNRADSFGSNTLTNNNSVGTTSQGPIVTGTANSRALILDFVKGVKAIGLWNNFVCWPLRSSQNAGTGTTAFSLGGLGTFNGTLVNGFPWGVNGLVKSAPAMELQLPTNAVLPNAISSGFVYTPTGTTGYGALRPFHLGTCSSAFDIGAQYLYSTSLNAIGVQQSRASAVVFTPNYTLGSGRAFLTNFIFSSLNASSTLVKVNNLTGNVQSGLNAKTFIPSDSSTVAKNSGAYGENGSAFGTHSFNFAITAEVSDTLATSLYNLYKSTLGVGLGLP